MTRIEALRQIVATNKAAKLDGHVVDTFTAARLLESYKALDGAGRRRFASMSVDKMVTAGHAGKSDLKDAANHAKSLSSMIDGLNMMIDALEQTKDPKEQVRLKHQVSEKIKEVRSKITDVKEFVSDGIQHFQTKYQKVM